MHILLFFGETFCFFRYFVFPHEVIWLVIWFNYNSTLNLVLDESNISHHLRDTKGFEQWDSWDAFGLAWCESWAQVTRITGECHCWGTPDPLIKKCNHGIVLDIVWFLEHWWRGKGILLNCACKGTLRCVLLHMWTDHFFFNSKMLVNLLTNY